MSTVMRNDKVTLTQEFGKLKLVGEVFEVGDITDKAIIIRDMRTKVALAAVDIDKFDSYFKVNPMGWLPWTNLNDMSGATIGSYRTNGKKVQVRMNNGIKAEATCNKTDKFNLRAGISIAMNRCQIKFLNMILPQVKEQVEVIEHDLKESKHNISQIINNLSKAMEKEGK